MREIKKYIKDKKNKKVIMINIGGVMKYFPILSFNFRTSRTNLFSDTQFSFETTASNLINLLSNFTINTKFNIYIDDLIFHGCFVVSYDVDVNNITTFIVNVDYLEIK